MAALEFLAGALVLAAVMYDVFQSIEVPRVPSRSLRLTTFLFRDLWSLWRRAALSLGSPRQRESFLGSFAPVAMLGVRFIWLMALVLAYGLIIHAMRAQFEPRASDWSGAF